MAAAAEGSLGSASDISPELLKEVQKSMTKPIIRHSTMQDEQHSEAMDIIISAVDKHQKNYEVITKTIKETLDKKFGPAWNCVVGEGFGFEITHEQTQMLYMFYQVVAVVVFKC